MPEITTVTVDHACLPPVSAMSASNTYDSSAVKLNWRVTPSPYGLSKFELQWRTNGNPWADSQTITLGPTAGSTWFVGTMGTTYQFRLRAFDNNGQAEAWPAGDAAEHSIYLTAKTLVVNSALTRNFCPTGDVDWYRLETSGWPHYLISTTPMGATGATVNLSVYAANGTTLSAKITAVGLFKPTNLFLNADGQSYVYIKAESNNPNMAGNAVQYSIVAQPQLANWLPLIHK
jgi:hypothetical protein